MIKKILIACLFFNGVHAGIFAQEKIVLWPNGGMPNTKHLPMSDSIANERVYQVGKPSMLAYFPSRQENKRAAVVICPGGGYQRLAYMISGVQLAKWFNTIGMSAFVLNYRLPHSPDLIERSKAPLQDLQRAIQLIRKNAVLWNIDSSRVGVMGSSAGGHLAAMAAVSSKLMYGRKDSVSFMSFLPDFSVLVSPVISMGEYAHAGSRKTLLGEKPTDKDIEVFSAEKLVSAATCPAFLVHAANDKTVAAENSLVYAAAMLKHKRPVSVHIFPEGGHAIALRNNPGSTALWPALCERWLIEMNFISEKIK